MARPDDKPKWADLDIVDPISNTPNKREPSVEKQDFGQGFGQVVTRQDINYLLNLSYLWIDFFDNQTTTGSTYMTTDATFTASDCDDLFGGSWSVLGDENIGGTQVYYFERS